MTTIELIGLRSSWRSEHNTLRGAIEKAEQRGMQAYQIWECSHRGRALRLQIGSSST